MAQLKRISVTNQNMNHRLQPHTLWSKKLSESTGTIPAPALTVNLSRRTWMNLPKDMWTHGSKIWGENLVQMMKSSMSQTKTLIQWLRKVLKLKYIRLYLHIYYFLKYLCRIIFLDFSSNIENLNRMFARSYLEDKNENCDPDHENEGTNGYSLHSLYLSNI